MATKTTADPAVRKNNIACKILHKESGIGIPDLLVVLFDVDALPDPENTKTTGTARARSTTTTAPVPIDMSSLSKLGDRLGSAWTDASGLASFEVDAFDFNTGSAARETKPDLLLVILTPEEPGLDLPARLLYFSRDIRMNAGSKEAYIVKLPTELLQAKGISIPKAQDAATDGVDKLAGEITANKEFLARKQVTLQEKIVNDQVAHKQARKTEFTKPLMDNISRLPQSIRDGNRFYSFDKNLFGLNADAFTADVNEFLGTDAPPKKKTVTGTIYLTEEEMTRYQPFLDASGTTYSLPDSIIEAEILPKIFRKTENGSSGDLIMDHPADVKCRNTPGSPDPSSDNGPAGGTTTSTPTLTEDSILAYTANQINTATSPEQELSIGAPKLSLEKRPNGTDIADSVKNAIFQKGPADVPAFYEFHSLKIAFEHIWQETFDLGLIDNAEKWYDQVKMNGGDPTKIFPRPPFTAGGSSSTPTTMAFSFGLGSLVDIAEGIADAAGDIISTGVDYVEGAVGAGASWIGGLLGGGSGGRTTVHDHRHDRRNAYTEAVALEFPEALAIWNRLTTIERSVLIKIADQLAGPYASGYNSNTSGDQPPAWLTFFLEKKNRDAYSTLRSKGRNLITVAIERLSEQDEVSDEYSSLKEAHALTRELTSRLRSNYSFKHYAANSRERSINFGILLSYQQKWEPLNYQAGELVKTIPLAPKEVRKFSKKVVVKKNRTQKEQEDNLRVSKVETQDTSRAESEIVNKASNKTAFDANNTSSAGISQGPVTSENNTSLTLHNEAERDSQQTKKEFHEAVVKASQEFKNERKVEISTEESFESEVTESGEISNPNDELTVTYLFYELQRQFRISERLYRLRPVIMVAQEMPAPHQIDNDWVVTYDWILKRVLLDDEFRYGMDCVLLINGERLLQDELEKTVREQRAIIKDLRQNVKFLTDEVARQNRLMLRTIDNQADIVEDRDPWDGIPIAGKVLDAGERILDGVGGFFGMGSGDDPKEAARIRTEAATSAYERAERERAELMERMERETSILNEMSKQLALKRKDIIEKETHIERLKVHIKDNILYYMQAIWSYEHKDQRFFRLLDTKVPDFDGTYSIQINAAVEPQNLNDFAVAGKTRHKFTMQVQMEVKEKTLKEVADLDNMLGYKGNYMIFPMVKSNILTDFMMTPYIDSEFGLLDPDNAGNWSLDDFEKYVKCLRKEMGDDFVNVEETLNKLYKQLLQDPLRNGDLITVPTSSLFIEALPGAHTILEYFKLAHRYMDVKKVQAEIRSSELENLRYAARILNKEHEDPKIDKKIVVEGNASAVVDTGDH